jgi:hypothetical protein
MSPVIHPQPFLKDTLKLQNAMAAGISYKTLEHNMDIEPWKFLNLKDK